jgi:putative PIN family toxin of toxin-antitoxin system
MRISIDTNVLVSYLLQPGPASPPVRIVHGVFARHVDLVISESQVEELVSTIRGKRHLASRVPDSDLTQFVAYVESIATITATIDENIPSISRDPGDDYLLAHAVLHDIEYLVTGDRDLLVLREFEGVRIVSPAEFVALLDELG